MPRSARTPCAWPLPHGSALALWAVLAAQAHAGPVVVVAVDPRQAWVLEDELACFAGALPVLHFPDWETLPYGEFNPHPHIVSQRIATLQRLPDLERGVLVVPATALMQRIAPPAHQATGLFLASGDALAPIEGRRRLEAAGYRRVPQVADPGDYALRGSVLDVYPAGDLERSGGVSVFGRDSTVNRRHSTGWSKASRKSMPVRATTGWPSRSTLPSPRTRSGWRRNCSCGWARDVRKRTSPRRGRDRAGDPEGGPKPTLHAGDSQPVVPEDIC
ncbi:MAG TPA: hypothetical protein VFH59_13825 [Frateuria sp.]|uniref:hypothetical protein n=1 Tax=Frateuria sp. TaxID=2211372 RepID=UPI002D7E2235|nr:hypothetical protein [Frateuria sp.]HET6806508.1 hypothetical protein [Frateuria sp.]